MLDDRYLDCSICTAWYLICNCYRNGHIYNVDHGFWVSAERDLNKEDLCDLASSLGITYFIFMQIYLFNIRIWVSVETCTWIVDPVRKQLSGNRFHNFGEFPFFKDQSNKNVCILFLFLNRINNLFRWQLEHQMAIKFKFNWFLNLFLFYFLNILTSKVIDLMSKSKAHRPMNGSGILRRCRRIECLVHILVDIKKVASWPNHILVCGTKKGPIYIST